MNTTTLGFCRCPEFVASILSCNWSRFGALGRRDIVVTDFVQQPSVADAQQFRGTLPVPSRLLQSLADRLDLRFGPKTAQSDPASNYHDWFAHFRTATIGVASLC